MKTEDVPILPEFDDRDQAARNEEKLIRATILLINDMLRYIEAGEPIPVAPNLHLRRLDTSEDTESTTPLDDAPTDEGDNEILSKLCPDILERNFVALPSDPNVPLGPELLDKLFPAENRRQFWRDFAREQQRRATAKSADDAPASPDGDHE